MQLNFKPFSILLLTSVIGLFSLSLRSTSFLYGWAGSPYKIQYEPFDYFYYKSYASIGFEKLRNTNDPGLVCREKVLKTSRDNLIAKMIYDSINYTNFDLTDGEEQLIGVILFLNYQTQKHKIEVKKCNPLFPDDPNKPNSEWKECRCILYLHIPGGRDKIIEEAQELQKMNL